MTKVKWTFVIGLLCFALAIFAYLLEFYISAMMFTYLMGQMTGILLEGAK